jgi:thiamine-monophosphate kinase
VTRRRGIARLGEFELIDRLIKPLSKGFPGALGLTDDAALVRLPEGCELVVAADAMVAGVHFLPDDPPGLIAGKLLRVNLSDLAAMGADGLGYLVTFARPASLDDAWLAAFWQGMAEDQARFGVHLLGGDTVSTTGPTSLSLTILGTVPLGTALRRGGARPGDEIWVSGTLGDAALGLRILRGLAATEDQALALIDRYRTPRPRLALGRALRGIANAAIDVSDGLVADLGHILGTSQVGARLEAKRLPISAVARSVPDALTAALTGGDDYELLFTAPPSAAERIAALATAEVPLTRIGEITAEPGLVVVDPDGRPRSPAARGGWQHF